MVLFDGPKLSHWTSVSFKPLRLENKAYRKVVIYYYNFLPQTTVSWTDPLQQSRPSRVGPSVPWARTMNIAEVLKLTQNVATDIWYQKQTKGAEARVGKLRGLCRLHKHAALHSPKLCA